MDAELAHRIGFGAIRLADGVPTARRQLRRHSIRRSHARVRALGLDFPSVFGLAAGFDKNGVGVRALASLGFGHIEVGTVTARPQPGNPKPRLFRLPDDRAVVNRMGFNNVGAAEVARNLARARTALAEYPRASRPIIGVNIGKSKVVPLSEAVDDYVESTTILAPLADYLVINVSSPNTPGLRDLQSVESLRPLISAVRATADAVAPSPRSSLGHVPLLVKIAPDLADDDVKAIADLAVELGVDGLIAANTTVSRAGLRSGGDEISDAGDGGLSGEPLRARAVEILKMLREHTGDKLTLVSVGGVTDADDVDERIVAGATLVQGYTGFLYEGPFWASRIVKGVSANPTSRPGRRRDGGVHEEES
ncbi:quinone-dependent dihydroorotate dehydrogenase [Spelaeicoccus albus]